MDGREEEEKESRVMDFLEPRAQRRIDNDQGGNIYRVNRHNIITDVIKINHSPEINHELAINADAYAYIEDPLIAWHLNDMAERVRNTGRAYEFRTYITTLTPPKIRRLYHIRIEKYTATDLLIITHPVISPNT